MRIAHYRAVPSKIDRRRPIEGEIDRRQSISAFDYRLREKLTIGNRLTEKKGRKRRGKEEEEKRKKYPLPRVVLARVSSPACRRRPHPRAIFLPRYTGANRYVKP
ncbi:hypothetical protein GW17_00019036 [Ensete ventricosum]|nr:hypothetical protein GW17_00019036 [Ensete ventricosum]